MVFDISLTYNEKKYHDHENHSKGSPTYCDNDLSMNIQKKKGIKPCDFDSQPGHKG